MLVIHISTLNNQIQFVEMFFGHVFILIQKMVNEYKR